MSRGFATSPSFSYSSSIDYKTHFSGFPIYQNRFGKVQKLEFFSVEFPNLVIMGNFGLTQSNISVSELMLDRKKE